MADDNNAIFLSREEQVVLFELLSRYVDGEDESKLQVMDDAEKTVLCHLLAALEKIAVFPFDVQYQAILESAKIRLTAEN